MCFLWGTDKPTELSWVSNKRQGGGLFLGDINMGTWPSRLGESQMRQSSMVKVLSDSDHWMIALRISDPPSRQRGRPTETRPQISDSHIPIGSNIWSQVPQGCSTPRHTDWLTVNRKVTSPHPTSMSRIVTVILIYHRQKPMDLIYTHISLTMLPTEGKMQCQICFRSTYIVPTLQTQAAC
jgi:hypothetical protein